MAFIYEVNGQRVEFDHEPTDKDIDEAARGLGLKPESHMPKPVEGPGGAAFGVYRPAGRRPASQNNPEASAEMGLQTARGVASNIPAIAGIPGSVVNAVANAPRTAQAISNRVASVQSQLAGNERQPEPQLPEYNQITPYDMAYFASLTPGPQPSSPQGQLAFAAGQMAGAPIVGPAARLGAEAIKAPINFGKGFARGIAYPEGTGANSALAPIRPTYVPHPQVEEFMAGKRPASSLTETPTAPLYENKPVANWAYGMAPENQAGQKLVPYAGRTLEGVGEQIGSQYRTNPLTGLVDIGTTLATGIPAPLTAIGRSIPALAARQLQKATNFEPGFGPAREAALAREGRAGIEANMPPNTPALPAPGPIAPTMIANQTGEVTAPGGKPLPTQASGQPVQQPVQPIAPNATPKQISQQMAAQKLAEQQQSWQQRANVQLPTQGQMPAPKISAPKQPKVQPVAPTVGPTVEAPTVRNSNVIKSELNQIANQSDELHQQGLEQGIKYGTPEGESHQAQLGQLHNRTKTLEKELETTLKEEKKAEKKAQKQSVESVLARAKKQPPEGVSQMLTEDTTGSFSTKRKFNAERDSEVWGSKDNPLTPKEHDEMKTWKGLSPEVSESSVWYKDKEGNTFNKYSNQWGELNVEKIDSKNPNKSTTYSRREFEDREGEWLWTKTEWNNGSMVKEEFFTPEGKTTAQISKKNIFEDGQTPEGLHTWPTEFHKFKE